MTPRHALLLESIAVCGLALAACNRPQPPRPQPPQSSAALPVAKPAPPAAPAPAHAPQPAPSVQQGQAAYVRICAVCHGQNGQGYVADQAPALAQPDFLASVNDELLRRAITHGRPGSTMSAWSTARGGPLAPADVDAVIAYMRTWEKQPRLLLDERVPMGVASRGGELYAKECARCHGARGVEGPNIHLADPHLLATATNGFLRLAIRNGRAGTPMQAFAQKLGDRGVEDILSFLRTLGSGPPVILPAALTQQKKLPLGPVPLNPRGPEPEGFKQFPGTTKVAVVHAALERHARVGLLDSRAPADYVTTHIRGAVSVPYYDPSPYLAKLPKNAWLVAYCACPHAESGELAQKLLAAGFKKVTVLEEGLGFWQVQGFAVTKGSDP